MKSETTGVVARQHWMSVLARADYIDLQQHWDQLRVSSMYENVRSPEIGMMMVQARTNGSGAPFNMGEMTVTRCTVRLASGTLGTAYIKGRNKSHAELAAVIDGELQDGTLHEAIQRQVIEPLASLQQTERSTKQAKAATTKVDFFTLVRGED